MASIAFSMNLPALKVWHGFASADECAELVECAKPRMARSTVLDRSDGASVVMDARTSQGAALAKDETPLVAAVTTRAAELLNVPRDNIEPLQVICYGVGDHYLPHNDWFDVNDPGSAAHLAAGGQRTKTLLVYLNTPEQGGATSFPDAGASVAAIAGNAAQFEYPTATHADLCLHGGDPVTVGEKWALNVWARERAYGSAPPPSIATPWIFNDDDCALLRAFYEANADRAEGPVDHVVRVRPGELQSFVDRVKEYTDAAFREPKVVETVVLARIPAGVAMHNHADNVRWTGSGYESNHTPDRTHTCVTFLNDGEGTTTFGENPDGQGERIEVQQQAGHAHIHRCGPLFHHRVSASSAPRYTFIVWFRRSNLLEN